MCACSCVLSPKLDITVTRACAEGYTADMEQAEKKYGSFSCGHKVHSIALFVTRAASVTSVSLSSDTEHEELCCHVTLLCLLSSPSGPLCVTETGDMRQLSWRGQDTSEQFRPRTEHITFTSSWIVAGGAE